MARRPFRERTRCPKCDDTRKHTVTTFSGTPRLHVYDCGTTFSVEGMIDQHRRCKKRVERNDRQGNQT